MGLPEVDERLGSPSGTSVAEDLAGVGIRSAAYSRRDADTPRQGHRLLQYVRSLAVNRHTTQELPLEDSSCPHHTPGVMTIGAKP